MTDHETRSHQIGISANRIARKPVNPVSSVEPSQPVLRNCKSTPNLAYWNYRVPTSANSATTASSVSKSQPLDDFEARLTPHVKSAPCMPAHAFSDENVNARIGSSFHTETKAASDSSRLAKAWEDARYFAGGLIHRPTESTKHYSVLRHSSAIVLFQGSETCVTISIFADRPLPSDRTVWLQQKGWTGKTGWRAMELFGANGGWVDVTPAIPVNSSQLPRASERAWQRDCKRFWDKEAKEKNHQLRETCIIRIPSEVEDGYFRVVVCGDGKTKNKLCPSPVFRILSISTAPSSIKGAGLSTLPLELGLKALTTVAGSAAVAATGPVAAKAGRVAARCLPSFWQRQAACLAYSQAKIVDKIGSANEIYQCIHEIGQNQVADVDECVRQALDWAPVIGPADGPQQPFPIRLFSVVASDSSDEPRNTAALPAATLQNVSKDAITSLSGIYFGWARVYPSMSLSKAGRCNHQSGLFPLWHPAIIYVTAVNGKSSSIIHGPPKAVSVYLIYDFNSMKITGSKIETLILGFLRPTKDLDLTAVDSRERLEEERDNCIADIAVTQASLSRSAWSVDSLYRHTYPLPLPAGAHRHYPESGIMQSIAERYVQARQAAQGQLNRVPIRRIGSGKNTNASRGHRLPVGGLYIAR